MHQRATSLAKTCGAGHLLLLAAVYVPDVHAASDRPRSEKEILMAEG